MISFNCDAENLSKLLGFPLPPSIAVRELCFDSDNTCGFQKLTFVPLAMKYDGLNGCSVYCSFRREVHICSRLARRVRNS